MSNSKLIELSYYDPSAQVRLSAYPDKSATVSGVSNGAQFPFRSRAYTHKEP